LSVRTEQNEGALVVNAFGEINRSVVDAFEQEVRRERAQEVSTVFLDLGEVEFIDRTGLGALFMAARRSNMTGDKLRVNLRVSPTEREALELMALADTLPSV
jgi:anti-anti-sigma factor